MPNRFYYLTTPNLSKIENDVNLVFDIKALTTGFSRLLQISTSHFIPFCLLKNKSCKALAFLNVCSYNKSNEQTFGGTENV